MMFAAKNANIPADVITLGMHATKKPMSSDGAQKRGE
jgi:hypothetical protein